jgi:hypothetical protein
MPRILPNLKSVVKERFALPAAVDDSSLSAVMNQLLTSMQSDLTNRASRLYSEAAAQMTNWTQDKSHGELVFLCSILAAIVLFVVVLPLYEALSGRSANNTAKRSASSSNSSITESLETIEESEEEEEEDVPSPVEEDVIINNSVQVLDSLKFVEEEDDEIMAFNLIPKASYDDDVDKQSDATPVDEEPETPTASPCVTPLRLKPTLSKDYVSVPDMASASSSTKRRSSFAKMKGKMASSMSFRRRDSSDASVTSTSSNRSFRMFSIKSKRD